MWWSYKQLLLVCIFLFLAITLSVSIFWKNKIVKEPIPSTKKYKQLFIITVFLFLSSILFYFFYTVTRDSPTCYGVKRKLSAQDKKNIAHAKREMKMLK